MRFNTAVNSFLAGELSPKMYGRTDLQQYFQGAEELHNQLVYVQGGTYRRPGSQYVPFSGPTGYSTGTWGENFETHSYVRVHPFTLSDGSRYLVFIRPGKVADLGTTGFRNWNTLNADTGVFGEMFGISTQAAAREYTEEHVKSLQFAQVGDYLIACCRAHPPMFIFPTTDGVSRTMMVDLWHRVGGFTPPVSGSASRMPFLTPNIENNQSQGTLTCAASSGSTTMTSSLGIFQSTHVGAWFKLTSAGNTGWVQVTGYTNATTVTVTVMKTVPTVAVGSSAGTSWEECAWSDYRGYPAAVAAFQQRVFYGGTRHQPDTVWGSEQGDIFELMARRFEQDPDFSDTLTNDRPFSFTIASTESSAIQWMSSGKNLFIGTVGREYISRGSTGSLGPLDNETTAESAYGSAAIQPIRYDSALYYCQRSGQSIRELVFNQDEDAYRGNNILNLAEHIVRKSTEGRATFSTPKIEGFAVQMTENPIIWMVDNNGGLSAATIDRANNIVAWTPHSIGGVLGTEPAKVISIASSPSANGQTDDLYLIVKRTVNGVDRLMVEKIGREFQLDSMFNSSTSLDDKPIWADCSIMAQSGGTPKSVFSGFDHLIGQTVDVIADGEYYGQVTVDSFGRIIVLNPKTEIIAGIPYTSRIKLLNPEVPTPVGTSQGKFIKVDHLTIRHYRTGYFKFGKSLTDLEAVELDSALATGDKRVTLHPGYERNSSIYIVQDRSLPLSVSCVIAEGSVNVS